MLYLLCMNAFTFLLNHYLLLFCYICASSQDIVLIIVFSNAYWFPPQYYAGCGDHSLRGAPPGSSATTTTATTTTSGPTPIYVYTSYCLSGPDLVLSLPPRTPFFSFLGISNIFFVCVLWKKERKLYTSRWSLTCLLLSMCVVCQCLNMCVVRVRICCVSCVVLTCVLFYKLVLLSMCVIHFDCVLLYKLTSVYRVHCT
jgi:hypothetical protein